MKPVTPNPNLPSSIRSWELIGRSYVTGCAARADACPEWDAVVCRPSVLIRKLRKSESAIPDTSRQLVADTICMPPHPVPVLTLLSSAIEGATARRRPGLTGVCWRRGEAPLLHHGIHWRAFQDYGGLQTGTAGVQVGRAEA
jgi:hypothetical protein